MIGIGYCKRDRLARGDACYTCQTVSAALALLLMHLAGRADRWHWRAMAGNGTVVSARSASVSQHGTGLRAVAETPNLPATYLAPEALKHRPGAENDIAGRLSRGGMGANSLTVITNVSDK